MLVYVYIFVCVHMCFEDIELKLVRSFLRWLGHVSREWVMIDQLKHSCMLN